MFHSYIVGFEYTLVDSFGNGGDFIGAVDSSGNYCFVF